MLEAFSENKRTYASYENAKKVIDSLEDGNYTWCICVNSEGRFFPHIILNGTREFNFHYFIEKGCCVTIT